MNIFLKPLVIGILGFLVFVIIIFLTLIIQCNRKQIRQNEPLGIPRGSVRAMLAILVVGSTILYLTLSDLDSNCYGASNEDPSHVSHKSSGASSTSSALIGFSGSVIGFYFGTRTEANKNHQTET
jgi:hypothetical protein